jgi:hypothetical protein
MKLEDIDGEVYITDSLLESLKNPPVVPLVTPKYTVIAGDEPVGTLKVFKSSPPLLELEFETSVDPGSLVLKLAGREISVSGIDFGAAHRVGEIACNVETSRCSVKAIHIEEVTDERRHADIRV